LFPVNRRSAGRGLLSAPKGELRLKSYADILDPCCFAWNKLIEMPWKIIPIGTREWINKTWDRRVEIDVSTRADWVSPTGPAPAS
jgi:hypothetical protein